jgi:opacity protein-like surface antigen
MRRLLPVALVALCATPALAQRNEIGLLGGYTTSANIEKKTRGIETLKVDHGFTWGAELGRSLSDHFGVEVSWARQQTAMVIGTSAGSADLFDMKLDALQGNLLYRPGPPNARLESFLVAGFGATFLSAEGLDSETKFSWSVGGGVKWFPRKRVGARIEARYAPTVLGDSSSDVCDPFGFCQGELHQIELLGGVVLRF